MILVFTASIALFTMCAAFYAAHIGAVFSTVMDIIVCFVWAVICADAHVDRLELEELKARIRQNTG
jgi:hypothetical protein